MSFIQRLNSDQIKKIIMKLKTKLQIYMCIDLHIFLKLVVIYIVTKKDQRIKGKKILHSENLNKIKKKQKEEEWRYRHRY